MNARKSYRKSMQKLIGEWCRSSHAIELYEVVDYAPGNPHVQYWKGYQKGLQVAIDGMKREVEVRKVKDKEDAEKIRLDFKKALDEIIDVEVINDNKRILRQHTEKGH